MSERLTEADVEALVERYRLAFERRDADAVSSLFAYPSQVLSQTDTHPVVMSLERKSQWLPQVKRLLERYQTAGVSSIRVQSLTVKLLSAGLALAFVEWSLHDLAGDELYRFDNVYTVGPVEGALKVLAAISPNELQRARRC